jgi:hypothetical protein
MDSRTCWIVSLTIVTCFFICMQQSRRAAMALRQLLVAARGGIAHPDIYPRTCIDTVCMPYPGLFASSSNINWCRRSRALRPREKDVQ